MNKSLIISGIALSFALASCHRSGKTETPESLMTVNVALPEVKDIVLSRTYPGSLVANSAIDVMCKVNGQVLTKNFSKGTIVRKGQVLYTIDPAPYRDKVQQAEAALSTAISARDYASEHYKAVKKALESDAVSKMEVSQAESSLQQAEASVKNATAALADARRLLGYCTVTAPIDGRIASGLFDQASYISGEASPVTVTTIFDNSEMEAQFAIEDERFLDIINARNSNDSLDFSHVPVRFAEPLPHTYTGDVIYLAPSLNETTGTLKVSCVIDNPYDELRQGMYVKIDLPYGRLDDAILVKDASVGSDQLGKFLYTLNDSNRIVYTPVTLGELYQDTLRVVTKGLKPGTRYVTSAILKVRNGMEVKPVMTK